jgi:peroxiredoxin
MHIPPYLENEKELTSKGVDLVVVIASNDPFVMNAWGKVNGCTKDSKVLFMSDSSFAKNHGWMAGMGDRNGRWAAIIEKDGTISYAENEKSPKDVDVSFFPSLRVLGDCRLTVDFTGLLRQDHPQQALDSFKAHRRTTTTQAPRR